MSVSKHNCQNTVSRLDIFGAEIGFTFSGNRTFESGIGGLLTICCITSMLVCTALKTVTLFSKENPFFTMTQTARDENDSIDLWKLGLMFAI